MPEAALPDEFERRGAQSLVHVDFLRRVSTESRSDCVTHLAEIFMPSNIQEKELALWVMVDMIGKISLSWAVENMGFIILRARRWRAPVRFTSVTYFRAEGQNIAGPVVLTRQGPNMIQFAL